LKTRPPNLEEPALEYNGHAWRITIAALRDFFNRLKLDSDLSGTGGAPADPDKSVQFNNAGEFGGDAAFTWQTNKVVLGLTDAAQDGIIVSPDATSADTAGTDLSITSGSGDGTGVGGQLDLFAGTGGSSANGGLVFVRGGTGGLDSGAGGGNVQIYGGDANDFDTGGAGGQVLIKGGTATLAPDGGDVRISGGAPDTGAYGNVVLNGVGVALATTAEGGFVTLPTCAGVPTGVPNSIVTGNAPVVFNTSANGLYLYNSGWQLIGGGGLSDGDKGDITVSSSGAVWTIDNDVVTYAKIQNVTTQRLLGRTTAGSGDTEEISLGTNLEFSGTTLNATLTESLPWNKIQNGAMLINQKATTYPISTSSSYVPVLDRWMVNVSIGSGAMTVSQSGLYTPSTEFPQTLRVQVNTAEGSFTGTEYFTVTQAIEGYNIMALVGHTFTISFWIRTSVTGTYYIRLNNTGNDRNYVTPYSVSASDTWEQCSVTVTDGLPALTSGTWNTTNGFGLGISFVFGNGTTYVNTSDTWHTSGGSVISGSETAQVNALSSSSNSIFLTGVQLTLGATIRDFEHRPYDYELAMCQRYLYVLRSACAGVCKSGTEIEVAVAYPVTMRTAPSLVAGASYMSISTWNGSWTTSLNPSSISLTGTILGPDGAKVKSSNYTGLTSGNPCILEPFTTTSWCAYFGAEM
jgi:Repeat of unknown function (DUF5907)